MTDSTVLLYVCHASVLIRHGDDFLLTDPWYMSPAFTSWTPCPPPSVNLEMFEALSRAGKLAVAISHAHPDHTDPAFLKRLDPATPIYIPTYGDGHFTSFLTALGLTNVNEISDHGTRHHCFELHDCPHATSRFDAVVSIETPDAFILHGNDAWLLGPEGKEKIRGIVPVGKPSLFMGQGGSASGFPLTYLDFSPEERRRLLVEKNGKMLRNIAEETRQLGFDRALAYACFTRISVSGKLYSFQAPVPTGSYANKVVGSDIFLDLSPGDIYLPAEDRVIRVLSSLYWPAESFPERPVREQWPQIGDEDFQATYAPKARYFLDALSRHLIEEVASGRCVAEELDVLFKIEVVNGSREEWSEARTMLGQGNGRRKTCRVPASIFCAVLDREVPFEDLYTGYLAEWSREPTDCYNSAFLRAVIEFGYRYLEGRESEPAAA